MADFGIGESLALAATVASTAVGVAGAASQANASKASANYNAQVQQVNAENATNQATFNANQKQQDLLRAYGSQGAAYGASGALGGSSDYVSEDTLVSGETDVLTQKYLGQIGANNALDQAALDESEAQSAGSSGLYSEAGSGLQGINSAFKIAQTYNPTLN